MCIISYFNRLNISKDFYHKTYLNSEPYSVEFMYWYKALKNSVLIRIPIWINFFKATGPNMLEKNPHGPILPITRHGGLTSPTFCRFSAVFYDKEKSKTLKAFKSDKVTGNMVYRDINRFNDSCSTKKWKKSKCPPTMCTLALVKAVRSRIRENHCRSARTMAK